MHGYCVKFVAVLMVVAFPSALLRADLASAMLTPVGNVTVNGMPITHPIAVFPGDKLQTDSSAMANVTMRGASVMIPGDSVVALSEKEFDLTCGSAVVNTVSGISTRVDKVTVSPAGTSARFEVTHLADKMNIFAREGALAVNNGTLTTLQPGRMMTAAAAPCSAAGSSQGPPAPAGRNIGVAVLVGIAVAAALAILVYETTKQPSSPSTP